MLASSMLPNHFLQSFFLFHSSKIVPLIFSL